MAAQDNLASKKPVVPLALRRKKVPVPLKMNDTVGRDVTMDSRSDRLSLSCIRLLDAKPLSSGSSLETTCSLDRDFEESRLAAKPICQVGYDVHEVLGSGSMAVTYRVVRRSDGQEFAAKSVRGRDEECRSVTIGEHNLMKELAHENVLQAKELFEFQAEIWLCTELCTEGNVHSYVRQHGAFGEGHCRSLARQLVEGAEYLHGKRVVHRDIKPENILLGHGASRLKIGDFNSAKKIGAVDARHNAVWMLSMRGTPLYSAPELRFDLAWNERVDVWSVGLSVYFMARAAPPFSAGSQRTVEALKEGKLPHVSWQGMPTAMAHLVQQCLIVDMRDRPTAMELRWHPAFEAVPGDQGNGSTQTPRFAPSGSDATVQSSCGLLFSCTAFRASRPGKKESWRREALRTLALQNIPTLEKLPSFGIAYPWAV